MKCSFNFKSLTLAVNFLFFTWSEVECGEKKTIERVIHAVHQSPRMYKCPDGFEQFGSGHDTSCVQTIEVPATEICKIGEWYNNSQCALKEPIIYTCPLGYKKKGRICAKIFNERAEPHCTEGILVGNSCHKKMKTPSSYICPLPQMTKARECGEWVSSPKILRCKPGFQLNGSLCYGTEMKPCSDSELTTETLCVGFGCAGIGFSKRRLEPKQQRNTIPTKMCSTKVEIQPIEVCPPGFSDFSTKKIATGSCVQYREVPLESYCPPESGIIDGSGQFCETVLVENAAYLCPASFRDCGKKTSGACCRIEYGEPLVTCSSGSSIIDNYCVTFHETHLVCPEGSALHGNVCKSQKSVAPIVQYAVNFETVGKHFPPPTKM